MHSNRSKSPRRLQRSSVRSTVKSRFIWTVGKVWWNLRGDYGLKFPTPMSIIELQVSSTLTDRWTQNCLILMYQMNYRLRLRFLNIFIEIRLVKLLELNSMQWIGSSETIDGLLVRITLKSISMMNLLSKRRMSSRIRCFNTLMIRRQICSNGSGITVIQAGTFPIQLLERSLFMMVEIFLTWL